MNPSSPHGPGRPPAWRRARLRGLVLPLALGVLLLGAAARPAQAVTFQEQIERLRLIYALLLDFRPASPPMLPPAGALDVTAELIPRPGINHHVGAKSEPIDPPRYIPRFRARLITPTGFMVGATSGVPVELDGYKATWLGGEAGLRGTAGFLHGELRAFRIKGEVTGPLTDPATTDTFRFDNRGLDFRVGVPLGAAAVYAGLGRGRTHTELDIAADGAHIAGDNDYTYKLAGFALATGSLQYTLEQQYSEDFLRNFILAVTFRW